jgi:ubiquinone biosynthesis accessory factor UbiJ
MLTQLNAHFLNHLLRQNRQAQEELCAYAGKVVRIALPPLQSTLIVLEDGLFAPALADAAVDAEIGLPPSAALRVLLDPASASSLVSLQGDTELAASIGKVLRELHWELEEDLSRIVGDIPAHQLTQAATRIKNELGRQALSLAGMFADYWLEEQPLIAKRRHLEQFARDVDALRDDAERLEKRLSKLEKSA